MDTIACWFSNGAASAVAAKKIVDFFSKTHNILIVNNPIKEEDEDNLRFKRDVQEWIQHPIIEAVNKKYPSCSIVDVFNDRKYMSGIGGAPCTKILKKEARYQFEIDHEIDRHVLGFTFEEKSRSDRFMKFERSNVIPILVDERITKFDCFDILHKANIKRPRIYDFGFPNANCIGCVKAESPTYWNLVRKIYPDVFNARCEQSRRIGCRLVKIKGEHRFLDELKSTDKGAPIKSWECGIFCDIERY